MYDPHRSMSVREGDISSQRVISCQRGSYLVREDDISSVRVISWVKIHILNQDSWQMNSLLVAVCLSDFFKQRLCPPISPSRVSEDVTWDNGWPKEIRLRALVEWGCHRRQQGTPCVSVSHFHSTQLAMFMRWLLLKSVTRDNRTTLVLFSRFLRFSDFSTPAPGNVDERVNDCRVSPETTEHHLCGARACASSLHQWLKHCM